MLGDLDREEASRLELGYFIDPARLRHMKETEDRLIRDYLEGRLSRSVKDRFELRYLSVPELRRRIEAIRAQTGFEREMSPLIGRRSRQTPWRLNPVLLGLILIVLAGKNVLLPQRSGRRRSVTLLQPLPQRSRS